MKSVTAQCPHPDRKNPDNKPFWKPAAAVLVDDDTHNWLVANGKKVMVAPFFLPNVMWVATFKEFEERAESAPRSTKKREEPF